MVVIYNRLMSITWGKQSWPDLSKDQRAIELAKTAMGWDALTTEQKMDRSRELAQRAQQIKETL